MELIHYVSRSGKRSGVNGFYIEKESIKVRFVNGSTYTYSYNSAGQQTVEEMKSLALDSMGLSTYIAKNNPRFVRSKFSF